MTTKERLADLHQQRLAVLGNSAMHCDALKILRLAKTLKTAIEEFTDEHSEETGFNLFVAAQCQLPSDVTHEGYDDNRDWSGWVYKDIAGFEWSLGIFISILGSNVYANDGIDDQMDNEVASPTVVIGS